MDYLKRLNRFFVGSNYDFQSGSFRGNFTVKKVKEKKLSFNVYDNDGLYDTEIDITVDLKNCEWHTISGYWYRPTKGFTKYKIKANKSLRIIIRNEVKSMLTMIGVPHRVGEVKINWLHEQVNQTENNQLPV